MEASPLVEYTNDEVLDGGMVLDVSCAMEDFARELHGHLKEKWLAESLPVQGLEDVRPIQGYDLTLEPYDPEEQLKATLRIGSHRVNPVCSARYPVFVDWPMKPTACCAALWVKARTWSCSTLMCSNREAKGQQEGGRSGRTETTTTTRRDRYSSTR